MTRATPLHRSDLRGAARLATEATAGLADLVEAMHAGITRGLPGLPGLPPPSAPGRTGGLTGLVYGSVRGVTRLVGGRVDALLGLLAPLMGAPADEVNPDREALLAALNGVLGDHLALSANPLATTMALRQQGRPLLLAGQADSPALAARRQAAASAVPVVPGGGQTLLLMLHGLCMNDLQWLDRSSGHDHGALLATQLGAVPLYLHCNSGRPIADNGADLARLIEDLLAHWPQPVGRLVLLGHSMGGLLARSALHQARQAGLAWPERVSELICLGTPHHGAPLERAGHGVDLLLANAPYAAPLARLGRLRSAGITDLRHGRLLAEPATSPEAVAAALPAPVPLPEGVRCFALAGCLGEHPRTVKARLLGDGLVPVDSALGAHSDAARHLGFAAERQATLPGVGHLALLSEPAVAAQLQAWLRG